MPRFVPPTLATILLAGSTAHADVTTAHPRIYVEQADLAGLQAALATDPDFIRMREWMIDRIDNQDAGPMVDGLFPQIVVTTAAFVGMMLPNEEQFANEARSYLAQIASEPPDAENALFLTRNRLLLLALGYDWLHDALPPDEAAVLRDAIYAYTTNLEADLGTQNYVSGPSRWANVVALAGALSIANDDARLDAALEAILVRWESGYNPVLDMVGEGGGHHMAWMYGPGYSGYEAPLMWRTASTQDETWAADFLTESAYFPIYAANGAYRLPPVEDCFGDTIYPGTLGQMALSSSLYENHHAEAFYQELETALGNALSQPPDLWLRLVTKGDATTPAPIDELPLTRLFTGSGFLVTRDTWSREDATTLVFKASPFYSIGHHQRDEGALYIDYRGPLLVDAGQYDGSGSDDHYRNFYSRSVAHNTLLVHWNEEDVPLAGFVVDGGQQVQLGQPQNVQQMVDGFELAGIVGSSDADACVWSRSDTADAYHEDKLTTYTRDVLEIRRPDGATHPAVYVLDRATLPEPRRSSMLWHFAANAVVDAENHRIDAEGADQSMIHPALSGGRIRLDLLRPAAPQIDTFAGPDRWTTDSGVHPPVIDDLLSPYWGRVEVSVEDTAPVWSTLIRVGDAELVDETLAPIDVGDEGWVGARLGDTIFAIAEPSTKLLTLPDGAPLVDGCVAGLDPNANIDVVVGDGEVVTIQANADGVAVYDPTTSDDTGSSSADGEDTTEPTDGGGSATADVTGDPTSPMTSAADTTGADTTGAGANDVSTDSGCGCNTPRRGRALASPWPLLAVLGWRRRRR